MEFFKSFVYITMDFDELEYTEENTVEENEVQTTSFEKMMLNIDVIANITPTRLQSIQNFVSFLKNPTPKQMEILKEMQPLLGMHHLKEFENKLKYYKYSGFQENLDTIQTLKKKIVARVSSRAKAAYYLHMNKKSRNDKLSLTLEEFQYLWASVVVASDTCELWHAAADSRTVAEMKKDLLKLPPWSDLNLKGAWKSMINDRKTLERLYVSLYTNNDPNRLTEMKEYMQKANCKFNVSSQNENAYLEAIEDGCNTCTTHSDALSLKAKQAFSDIKTFLKLHEKHDTSSTDARDILNRISSVESMKGLPKEAYTHIFMVDKPHWLLWNRHEDKTSILFMNTDVLDKIKTDFEYSKIIIPDMSPNEFEVTSARKQEQISKKKIYTYELQGFSPSLGSIKRRGTFHPHNKTFVFEGETEAHTYTMLTRPIQKLEEYKKHVATFVDEVSKKLSTLTKEKLCSTMCAFHTDNRFKCEQTPGCQYSPSWFNKEQCVPISQGTVETSKPVTKRDLNINTELIKDAVRGVNTTEGYACAATILGELH